MPPTEALDAIELVLLLLAVAVGIRYLARRVAIAEPILLLAAGVLLGLYPNLPQVELEPDIVFALFLPPILFAAAYFTPIRDFRADARAILLLAVGLVLFTAVAVGLVAQAVIPTMSLAAALTLGAIVAPPDAVAATAIFRRLGVPRRIVTILEGESLVNDATSLTLYRAAAAVATAAVAIGTITFSPAATLVDFLVIGAGGVLVGVLIGLVMTALLRRTGDPVLEIAVTLIAPPTTYLFAERFGVSGVLAVVIAGLITGRRAARVLSPDARLLGSGAWQILIWAINAVVFMAIGLQLPTILAGLSATPASVLIGYGVAISATVILARIVWALPSPYLTPGRMTAEEKAAYPTLRVAAVVSWAGMRGVVSLAAALALAPDFPERPLILYLTFCVIVATLVGQGLTLPWVIRKLRMTATGDGTDGEETHARLAAVDAGLARVKELREDYPDHLPLLDQIMDELEHEVSHVAPRDIPIDEAQREALDHRAIRAAVRDAEREAVIQLRDDGVINDETLRRIELELDLEAVRSGD
ncbi:MAG TPA: Na+/H+ antiporter [Candidatus Limnocylindrales bacterium]|nr:Na+/H+ antiporter [Candidatus Limnocylindrales bacterium]